MKNWLSLFVVVLLFISCKSDLYEEEMEMAEPSNELSELVTGKDLLRYFSKNINSSHNNTVLMLFEDSACVLGKEMDSMLAINDSMLLELYWQTNDWLRSQKVNDNGEEKYFVKMTDLLPGDNEVKEHFPKDFQKLKKLRPSEGMRIARDRSEFNFFYQMGDSVFLQRIDRLDCFSKEEFNLHFDSLKMIR